jgi:hypothetical protein
MVMVVGALVGCCCGPKDEPPGYSGPYPSSDAQTAVHELDGKTVKDASGKEWTVGNFGVIPNPVTGKGPVVDLTSGGVEQWLPLETDGDVADLWMKAKGAPHPKIGGPTSEAYRKAWDAMK